MIAMFNNVKEFASFNAKPHLFSFSEPYQKFSFGDDQEVFIDLIDGCKEIFKSRVEQFGGLCLGC